MYNVNFIVYNLYSTVPRLLGPVSVTLSRQYTVGVEQYIVQCIMYQIHSKYRMHLVHKLQCIIKVHTYCKFIVQLAND